MHSVWVVSIDCTTESIKVGTVLRPHTTMIILASVFTRQSQEQALDTKLLVPTQVIRDECGRTSCRDAPGITIIGTAVP